MNRWLLVVRFRFLSPSLLFISQISIFFVGKRYPHFLTPEVPVPQACYRAYQPPMQRARPEIRMDFPRAAALIADFSRPIRFSRFFSFCPKFLSRGIALPSPLSFKSNFLLLQVFTGVPSYMRRPTSRHFLCELSQEQPPVILHIVPSGEINLLSIPVQPPIRQFPNKHPLTLSSRFSACASSYNPSLIVFWQVVTISRSTPTSCPVLSRCYLSFPIQIDAGISFFLNSIRLRSGLM